jgi:hypothetical protein
MKKIVMMLIIAGILLGSLSGCSSKPKPETTIITFLDAYKASQVIDYSTVFNATYFTNPISTGTTSNEITEKMMALILSYEYDIIKTEVAKDGLTATVTVQFTTVDLGLIFKTFMATYMAKVMELALNHATVEEINQAMIESFDEASKDAPKNKVTTAPVKMVLVNKVWLIKAGEENLAFFDGIMGGYISSLKNQTPINQ